MPVGLIDTNVFLHAQTHDSLSAECLAFLDELEQGRIEAYLDVLVVHELTYALPRYRKQMTRADVAAYVLAVLQWPGIVGETTLLADTVELWADTPGLGFVDAYLIERATRDGAPVFTKNVAEFAAQDATVPDPLPGAAQP